MQDKYEQQLLDNWEEVFRQGLLTFWVFVAIADNEMSIADMRIQVEELTGGTYQTSDQALYRLLRKQYDLEMVDMREVKGNGGPKKKLYSLSPIGKRLLTEFTRRNIRLFDQPQITSIIEKGC